ncbi:MAG: permease-like cell division protein FtsX [Mariprofundaceae bacterium]|nr:permease-like cell division protein FtsX [Mariprofundaceae bacterium]
MHDMPDQVNPRLPGGFQMPPFGIHQFLALMIVCVALWALGAVWLGLQGAQQWVGSWQDSVRLHVYLPVEKSGDMKKLNERLAALDGVASVRQVSREEAAVWMQGWLGGTSLNVSEFAKRLPESLELTLSDTEHKFLFSDIRDEAARFGGTVNEDEVQMANAHQLLQSIQNLAWFATLIIAMAMALIVSNTLRMILLARADEVHLMRLLGAREWFVRMPFILEGTLLGSGAAILAWMLLWPLVVGVSGWTDGLGIDLHPFALLLPLLAGGALVGCLGAVVATARLVSPDSVDQ